MQSRFKWITILLVVLALLLPLFPAQAVSPNLVLLDALATCSSAGVLFIGSQPNLREPKAFSVDLELWIDGELADTASVPLAIGGGGLHTFYFEPLSPTTHTIEIFAAIPAFTLRFKLEPDKELLFSTVIDCTQSDGRFCFAPGEAPAAVYSYTDDAGKPGLMVYAITGGSGSPVIELDSAALAALPGLPASPVLIAEAMPYNIALYKLPSGAFQINVDDDRVVKTHVCEFRGVPPLSITVSSFE